MTTKHVKKSKVWHIGLWVVQVLLAAMFLMVGYMKTFTPIPELSKIIPLAAEMPGLTRFIGVSELMGGLGLLLPAALRILPQLTILAAAALALVMLLALVFHISRGENESIGTNIILGLMSSLVVWGRLQKAPILAKPVNPNVVAKN